MNAYQIELLKLAKRIATTFEKRGVRYFGVFGTCLGAARHQGIVPWDEDIDFAVFRADYEKATSALREECPDIFVWDIFSDDACSLNYGRVFNRIGEKTSAEQYKAYVDLYVFDDKTQNALWGCLQRFWMTIIHHRLARCVNRVYFKERGLRSLIFRGIEKCLAMCSHEKLKELFVKWQCVGRSDNFAIAPHRERFWTPPKTFFNSAIRVPFNDFFIFIPAEFDQYLVYTYGDWRTPPPENKRHGNAYYENEWIVEHPKDQFRLKNSVVSDVV